LRTTPPSPPSSRGYAVTFTAITTGLVLLAGCSVSVRPFPQLATAETADELRVAPSDALDATTAAVLDRDDDGRLDLTAPLRHGISFEGDERLEMVVDGTTVCVDGPGGTVTSGPC
jgi:hypothetical protein